MEFLLNELTHATFWVAVALILFLGVLVYAGAHKMIAKGLDERADKIKQEIDEASKLREEAQALLANYQRKKADAEKEAAEIVEQAKKEAELLRTTTALCGLRAPERLYTMPIPARIAQTPESAFTSRKMSRSKARYLVDIASAAASGSKLRPLVFLFANSKASLRISASGSLNSSSNNVQAQASVRAMTSVSTSRLTLA